MVSSKTKSLILFITLATITVNLLAISLPLGGLTTAEISDKFQIYFIPAGYVFSIWSVIYFLLFVFSLAALTEKDPERSKVVESIAPYYYITGLLNCSWIISWHTQQFFLSLVVMTALVYCLYRIYFTISTQRHILEKTSRFKIMTPFRVYTAWITVAAISNLGSYLDYIHWTPLIIPRIVWTAFFILAAGILAAIFSIKYNDRSFPLVIIWAIMGIAFKFPNEQLIKWAVITSVTIMVIGYIASLNFRRPKPTDTEPFHTHDKS